VREGVIAQLESLPEQSSHNVGVAHDLTADDEERGRHVKSAQNRCDPRRPAWIGPVVEAESDPCSRPEIERHQPSFFDRQYRPRAESGMRRPRSGRSAVLGRVRRKTLNAQQKEQDCNAEPKQQPVGRRSPDPPAQELRAAGGNRLSAQVQGAGFSLGDAGRRSRPFADCGLGDPAGEGSLRLSGTTRPDGV
jgi:hypothetical protein